MKKWIMHYKMTTPMKCWTGALHRDLPTRQARKAAAEYMRGYTDVPRFKNAETNEMLRRHGRRDWCMWSRDMRIVQWLLMYECKSKYVSAIAQAADISELDCKRLYKQHIADAWVAHVKNHNQQA